MFCFARYPHGIRRAYDTSQEALRACDDETTCGGVTREARGIYTLRRGGTIAHSDTGEFTFVKNADVENFLHDSTTGEPNTFLQLPRTLEEAHQMLPTLKALASLSEVRSRTGNKAPLAKRKSKVDRSSSEKARSERTDHMSSRALQAQRNDDDNEDASLLRLIPGPFLAQAAEVFARCEGNTDGVFNAEPWLILQRAAQQCAALDQSETPNSCPKELRHWTAFNLAIQMQRLCRAGWARIQTSGLMRTDLTEEFVVKGGNDEEAREAGGKLGLPPAQIAMARRLYWGAALSGKPGDASVWQRWALLEEMDGRPNACVQVLSRGAVAVAATIAVATSTHAKHLTGTAAAAAAAGGAAIGAENADESNDDIAANLERAVAASQLYHSLGAHLHDHRAWGPALSAFQNALQVLRKDTMRTSKKCARFSMFFCLFSLCFLSFFACFCCILYLQFYQFSSACFTFLQVAASSNGDFFEPLPYYEWHYGNYSNGQSKKTKSSEKNAKKNPRTKAEPRRSDVAPLNEPLDAARLQAASQTLYMGHMLADWSIVDSLRPQTLDVLDLTLQYQRRTQRGSSPSRSPSSSSSQGTTSGLAAVAMAWEEAFRVKAQQASSVIEHSSQRPTPPQVAARGKEIEVLAPLPALHPWMSMCLPMAPRLRLAIAEAFAFRLHTVALAPVALGGQAFSIPQLPSPQELAESYYVDYTKMNSNHDGSSVGESANNIEKKHRRLRVGFVSADFKQKATAYLCVETFQHFNR